MHWNIKPVPESSKVAHLKKVLGIPEKIAYLLVQRGVETYDQAKDFFRPDLAKLHDPYLMKDMELAVERLVKAIRSGEHILVYGDYDVDGATSVALMASYLQTLTPKVATYIPDRYKEGYGISYRGIDYAHDNDVTLIVALDCGIKAIDQIAYARTKNIDFVICDHHLPGEELPEAVAVLDPKRSDCGYPFKELCGCGVGFKLIQALNKHYNQPFELLIPYLDLVAVATAADIVPVTGENRILAYHGLHVINTLPRVGLKALMEIAKKRKITNTDLMFSIGPRINAAGRMGKALRAAKLLMEDNTQEARKLAWEIEQYNSERKDTDTRITEEALEQIVQSETENRKTTVVFHESWHKGVIGIVASRLTETYYRPTLVFTKSGNKLTASARSIKGFDIYTALEACAEHIEQFGGHKYAAGLTIAESSFSIFKDKFEAVVSELLDEKLLSPIINSDMKLDFDEITPKFFRLLKQFAPFGPGNPLPVFYSTGLRDTGYARALGKNKDHLKCRIFQRANGVAFEAIGFGMGDKLRLLRQDSDIDALYSLDENTWNNQVTLQLKLRDLR